MCKVLVISPTPSHPQNAGNRARIYSLLAALKQTGCYIHFVHVQQEKGEEEDMEEMWDRFDTIPYQYPPSSFRRRSLRKIMKFLPGRIVSRLPGKYYIPYHADDWYQEEISRQVQSLTQGVKYDVVLIEYLWFSKALSLFNGSTVKIIDTHDVFAGRHKLYLSQGEKPRWFYTTKGQERKALQRADYILAIQKHEAAYFQQLTGKPSIVVGHLSPLLNGPKREPRAKTLLFVGSKNPINVSAVKIFVEKVLPQVRANEPDVQLNVVGRCANELGSHEGVNLVGEVDSLAEEYQKATIVVNPVQYGTGLKIKTIEALAAACPLVTTRAGAAGLEDGAGKAFLLGETADEFAESILRILRSPKLAAFLSKNAVQYAKSYNQRSIQPLLEVLPE